MKTSPAAWDQVPGQEVDGPCQEAVWDLGLLENRAALALSPGGPTEDRRCRQERSTRITLSTT